MRIGARHQFLQIFKENLAGDLVPVSLQLQRLPRPVDEHWRPQMQDRFVHERDRREHRQFDIGGGIAPAPGVVFGLPHRRPDLRPERHRVRHLLPVGAQPLAHGQQFLKHKRQVFLPVWSLAPRVS